MSFNKPFAKISLDPENKVFAEIMSNGKKYIIPKFQRDYSWEQDNWDELWQDIEKMRENRVQHFMGYLVFQTHDGKTLHIIDGQQRLTTISILLLAALSRLQRMIESNQDADDNRARMDIYQKTYIQVADPVTLRESPKLSLNRHNDAHFRSLTRNKTVIQQRNITQTNRKINKAFQFFSDRLKSLDSGEQLAALISDVADGLLFTTITVKDDLNAYTVFETLNARGLHLSTPDLLKNNLLSILARDEAYTEIDFDDFEEQWAGILSQLGETGFTDFLRSHTGLRRTLPHKTQLYRVLKSSIIQPEQVLPYLNDLGKYAAIYAALQSPHDNFWKDNEGRYTEASQHLEVLRLFNIKTPLSLLMAAYTELSASDFIKLLARIVALTIRYNVICVKPANEQERIYNKIANQLMTHEIALYEATHALLDLYPEDDEFKQRFASKTLPNRQSSKKILYLLSTIEQHLSSDKPPANLTVEHVLPFSPEDAWQAYFGRDTYEQAIDRLGNMGLLAKKDALGQEPFNIKQTVLADTPYQINQHIASYDEWNIDNLQNHQNWLAKQACAVWKISY